MIKAVIFDMDGVLIDAREWHYEALNQALALFGFEISRHDHLTMYDGLPTSTKLAMLSREAALPVELHRFINTMKQHYTQQLVHRHCHPVFAIEYALSRLAGAGYRLVCCSNSIRQTMDTMLGRAALLPYLEFYLSNEDVREPKPHPEIYQSAMSRLGLKPDSCLIVEDNPNGIRAAQASGAHVMRVADPSYVTFRNIMAAIDAVGHGGRGEEAA